MPLGGGGLSRGRRLVWLARRDPKWSMRLL